MAVHDVQAGSGSKAGDTDRVATQRCDHQALSPRVVAVDDHQDTWSGLGESALCDQLIDGVGREPKCGSLAT
jgi:hypothetical protein